MSSRRESINFQCFNRFITISRLKPQTDRTLNHHLTSQRPRRTPLVPYLLSWQMSSEKLFQRMMDHLVILSKRSRDALMIMRLCHCQRNESRNYLTKQTVSLQEALSEASAGTLQLKWQGYLQKNSARSIASSSPFKRGRQCEVIKSLRKLLRAALL